LATARALIRISPPVNLNVRDSRQNTPLILAVKTRNVELVELLLSAEGLDIDASVRGTDGGTKTALELSLKCAAVHQVQELTYLNIHSLVCHRHLICESHSPFFREIPAHSLFTVPGFPKAPGEGSY